MTDDKLEGRIKAIEAILLELPELTPKLIDSAKENLKQRIRARDPRMAEICEKLSGQLDEHAENALDDLKHRAKNR